MLAFCEGALDVSSSTAGTDLMDNPSSLTETHFAVGSGKNIYTWVPLSVLPIPRLTHLSVLSNYG